MIFAKRPFVACGRLTLFCLANPTAAQGVYDCDCSYSARFIDVFVAQSIVRQKNMESSVPVIGASGRYYTPWQITVATILGGSLAGGFLALRNHILFGAPTKATVTAAVSVVILIFAIIAGLMMPPHVSRSAGAFLIAIGYRWYAESAFGAQILNRRVEGWTQHSWWQVIGIAVAFLAGMLLLLFLGILIFEPDKPP
jgi:hypothetical protein